MNQSRGPNQAPNAQPSAARWIVTAVAAIALIILIFALLQTQSNEESLPEESLMSNKEWSSPPKMTIDEQNEYTAVIETDLGNIVLRLFANESPITVNNFVFLAQQGYYDGVMFHRVIHDFMVQGGDISCGAQPLGSAGCNAGTGGYSGIWYGQGQEDDITTWSMPDEFDCTQTDTNSPWVGTCHAPGMLAMANSGTNTGGSQFYLVDKDSTPSHLNGKHTVFGMATDDSTYLGSSIGGIELVNMLSEVPTIGGDEPHADQPSNPPYIHSIEIDGDIAYMHLIMP